MATSVFMRDKKYNLQFEINYKLNQLSFTAINILEIMFYGTRLGHLIIFVVIVGIQKYQLV